MRKTALIDYQNISVFSEIDKLEAVIVHSPGPEVANVTPLIAQKALYSDILNYKIASEQHDTFRKVLEKYTRVYQVKELLMDILKEDQTKYKLIFKVCENEDVFHLKDYLLSLNADELATQLIEGVEIKRDSLTNYLSKERYALAPLHNFFYTRDASVSIGNTILPCHMANNIREREALIMSAIFRFHPQIETEFFCENSVLEKKKGLFYEGGDILVARHDILLIGLGPRTSSTGIDSIVERIKQRTQKPFHVLVQELPEKPESFIHLDMAFTFLDRDQCMTFEPVIRESSRYGTYHIHIENGSVKRIHEVGGLISGLRALGMDLEPLKCGGDNDESIQEREQWHSGTNFFAIGPGKLLGYGRNQYTIEAMNNHGYEIIAGRDLLSGKQKAPENGKFVITIEGSELARGGGGARCMTMPIKRS
ncbi:MAG: arginine deiminase [Bacteroidia bacterium]|nr:arginine deiminase [Bacteroidia bacterium]